MNRCKIYYKGEVIFNNLNDEQIFHLEQIGYIKKEQDFTYILLNVSEIKYLFDDNIPFYKKKSYFRRLNEKQLICEDCGAPYSFHIRPQISEGGIVNFKKIVCVCKKCRFSSLTKKDILTPQFKKKMTNDILISEIEIETKDAYNIVESELLLENTQYIQTYIQEKKLYALTKVQLPPLSQEEWLHKKIRKEMEQTIVRYLGKEINLEDNQKRIEVKKYLLGESYGVCPCCGEYMTQETITIDHIIAKSKGGDNSIYNFIGLCESCNQDKDSESILSFLAKKSFKLIPHRVLVKSYAEQDRVKTNLFKIRNELEDLIEQILKK